MKSLSVGGSPTARMRVKLLFALHADSPLSDVKELSWRIAYNCGDGAHQGHQWVPIPAPLRQTH